MKQIEKVSISGISFMLDVDAFHVLNQYLTSLKEAYKGNPDGEEIIADIEARMAEIILSKQDARTIVGKPLADNIVAQLGMPEEAAAASAEQREAQKKVEHTFPRRLYRNMDGAKLGGVCNGIATFFDVDPVWVRLSVFLPLVLLILTSPFHLGDLNSFLGLMIGIVGMVYFIMWFVVPSARTPRQKLEMRGERITASSIEDNLRREISSIGGDSRQAQKTASVWSELFYTMGRVVLFCVKAVALLFTLAMALFGICLVVTIGTVLSVGVERLNIGDGDFQIFLHGLSGIAPDGYVAMTALLALIPVFIIVWLLICLIFDRPLRGRVFSILGGVWLILAVFWGVTTARELNDYDGHGRRIRIERTVIDGKVIYENRIDMDSLQSDSLRRDTISTDGLEVIVREVVKN